MAAYMDEVMDDEMSMVAMAGGDGGDVSGIGVTVAPSQQTTSKVFSKSKNDRTNLFYFADK